MSFIRKIQKVLAMLSPWASVKSPAKKRKKRQKSPQARAQSKKTPVKKRSTQKRAPVVSKKKPGLKKKTGTPKVKSPPVKKIKALKKRPSAQKKPSVKVKKNEDAASRVPTLKTAKPKRILVGEVTHYFDRAQVAAFMVTGAPIILGDALEFEGKCATFRQEIKSLQIDRVPVKSARAGDEVGLLVKKQVYEGDYVFKVL